jgi:hypothetical protein
MNSTVQKLNSMVPFATNAVRNSTKAANFGFGNATLTNLNAGSKSSWNTSLLWFMLAFLFLVGLFVYYYDVFMNSTQNWVDSMNTWITGRGGVPKEPTDDEITRSPSPPQDEGAVAPRGVNAVVEKILPPAKDVFTVSKNDYTYYDAAPLCKALGAELATYDQVKKAWQKGADWCNYGWVKGQMAVYPTQNSTYEELQDGPDDQKGACGKPGINGGYFDNPELKFGVTCIGKKPAQSKHDANAIAAGSTRPMTASGLEFEKKVLQFKQGSDSIGILPFNREQWDT